MRESSSKPRLRQWRGCMEVLEDDRISGYLIVGVEYGPLGYVDGNRGEAALVKRDVVAHHAPEEADDDRLADRSRRVQLVYHHRGCPFEIECCASRYELLDQVDTLNRKLR
ncbi:unnamed protein product [Clavelina lepadiformis]|uniref:Uncharacterized protein n=1 Tax=Clavelina lepadiformis TaxID=159417 RepID=A0ABP0G6W1_CLALP